MKKEKTQKLMHDFFLPKEYNGVYKHLLLTGNIFGSFFNKKTMMVFANTNLVNVSGSFFKQKKFLLIETIS